MKKRTKVVALIIMAAIMLTFIAACGPSDQPTQQQPTPELPPNITPVPGPRPTVDRLGRPITLPDFMEEIMTLGPAVTETVAALGFGDRIVATDDFSYDVPGLNDGIELFSMMSIDLERILVLQPDVILATTMIWAGGGDPLTLISDAGISVVYIPVSESIADIKEDIRFLAAVLDVPERGESIVSDMQREIDSIRAIGQTITDRRTVYFEISPVPFMFSFGHGVFLHEMIYLIGAVNVLGDEDAWISVSEEAILALNPDVILTNVNFNDDPVGEIMNRPGWEGVTAIINGDVYQIDTGSSSRPTHNIVIALREMALAVYPEHF